MKDIEISKKLFMDEELTIAIVKDGKVIYKSRERGIKPIYVAYTTLKDDLIGCSASDKVVGKAAAWIYKCANIKELYCNIITEEGAEFLQSNGIKLNCKTKVEHIKNRNKDALCPVENISINETNFENLLINIKKFLEEKNLI